MFLKFKVSCTCGCEYSANENISTDKIICPNCGTEYPHSAKLISILKTAKEIPDGNILDDKISTRVIPKE